MHPTATHGLGMLWPFYRNYLRDLRFMVFFFLFQHAYEWFSPILGAVLIDLATQPGPNRLHTFAGYGGLMLFLIACNLPASLLRTRYQSRATRGVSQDLRLAICRHLQQLTLHYHDQHSLGRLQSKAIRDIETLERLPGQFVWLLVVTFINMAVAVVTIAIRVPRALLFFSVLIPISVALRWYFRSKMETTARRYRKAFENLSARITDMVTMIPVTRAHGLERYELDQVTRRIQAVFRRGRRFDNLWELFSAANYVTFVFSQGLFFLGAIYFCFQGVLTIGDVVMFNAFFASISGSLLALVNVMPVLISARESAASIAELLQAPDSEANEGKQPVRQVMGALRFEAAGYQYPGTGYAAVAGLDLAIPAGQSVALVGPSGAGKSTVLALVLGFIRPTTGRILLDGHDMQMLDLRTYRAHVGVVTQSIVFFSGTIRDNVAYGAPDLSDQAVEQVLHLANAWEFVARLPKGMHTRLGESGIKLSGGQHQRLAIARALVRDPRVLILDEATSALDVETELLVQEALQRVMRNRTCLVVAHRLSTVRICDRIVVLEQGRIATEGSHGLLLRAENFYSRVVRATA